MNSGQAIRQTQALLRAAGAVPVRRKGGHETWRFPSGAIFPVQTHGGAWKSRTFKQRAAAIKRLARADGGRVGV